MLEGDYQERLTQLISKLPCRVEIPEKWGNFLEGRGPLPAIPNDRRRFVRHQFRGKAVLEVRQSLPSIEREHQYEVVYMRDLSRQGISFVHSGQLFPTETCRLWLPERKITLQIVRCQRVQERCYVVGGTLGSC